jgi:hypothetical protein
MAKLIGEFLSGLVEDNDKLQAYLSHPEKALKDSGLTESQQRLLIAGDAKAIRAEIKKEYGKGRVVFLPLALQHIMAPPPPDET